MDANIQGIARRHSANWMSDIPISGPEDVVIDHVAGSEMWLGFKYMYLLRDRAPSHVVRIRLPEPGAQAERFEDVPLTPVYDDEAGRSPPAALPLPSR